jgi:Arc/MetJ-type ribon-helix-helix transcriptional regulator
MSSPYDPNNPQQPPPPSVTADPIDDLALGGGEFYDDTDRGHERMSSVRDIASRIPESLSSIGRDISRTIERAISAKDDYVVAVKVTPDAQEKLENLVQAGVFRSRAEAAAYLIDEGIKAQSPLFERVNQKLSEIERLRAELRGMIGTPPA